MLQEPSQMFFKMFGPKLNYFFIGTKTKIHNIYRTKNIFKSLLYLFFVNLFFAIQTFFKWRNWRNNPSSSSNDLYLKLVIQNNNNKEKNQRGILAIRLAKYKSKLAHSG